MGIALAFSVVLRSLGLLVVAVIPIRVTTTDGKTVEAEFAGVDETNLSVTIDGQAKSFPLQDLQQIVAAEPDDDATGPTIRVTLSGGSQIAAQDLTLADEKLFIEPRRQSNLTVPVTEVKSIRFRAASAATDAQWLGLVEQESRGDLLAIRRANDQLDPAPGLVEAIGDGVVKFNMEGDTVDAPIERLEGVVLRSQAKAAKTVVQVADQYGSRYAVLAILPSAAGEPLKLKLSDSVTHTLPLKHLRSIFFSDGLQMLATEKPAQVDYTSYVATQLDGDLQSNWFAPIAQGEDVLMNGGGSLEYRVGDEFTKLAGSVRRDESVDKAGEVSVEIFVDDRSVWKESLTDAQPRGFELPVKDARRIRFVADSGSDGDLGDKVRITRPRLLK